MLSLRTQVHFQMDEMIYRMRDPGGEMFFVTKGMVDLKSYKGLLGEGRSNEETSIFRPSDLAKRRTAEQSGEHPYFGELSFFPEICSMRTEDAQAKTAVQVLSLSLDKAELILDFSPEFHKRLFDFCKLSASRWGVSNEAIRGSKSNFSRGFPKIDQMCLEFHKELLLRHQQVLHRGSLFVGEDEVKQPEDEDERGLEEGEDGEEDEVSFPVMKRLNATQKKERVIVLNRLHAEMINTDPEGKKVSCRFADLGSRISVFARPLLLLALAVLSSRSSLTVCGGEAVGDSRAQCQWVR